MGTTIAITTTCLLKCPTSRFTLVDIGDSVPTNSLAANTTAEICTSALVWKARCESHELNLIVVRPVLVYGFMRRLYGFSRLLRYRVKRDALWEGMKCLVRTELPGNILVGVRPDNLSTSMLEFAKEYLIMPAITWCEQALDSDALVRMSHVRASLRDNIPFFLEMSSLFSRQRRNAFVPTCTQTRAHCEARMRTNTHTFSQFQGAHMHARF